MRSGFAIFLGVAMMVLALPAAGAPLDIDPAHPPDGYEAPQCKSTPGTGYPVVSRRLGEQGQAELRYEVDAEGHVSEVEIVKSSGYQRLDAAAIDFVGAMRCTPATVNGKPVAVRVPIVQRWTLKEGGSETPIPAAHASGIKPPVALTKHGMTEGDYPPLARARGEQGVTLVYYVIKTDGSVGEARVEKSSGYADLDAAAIEMVKTWRFKPATRDGKPIAISNRVNINWRLEGPPPQSSPYFTTVHMTEADYPLQAKAAKEEGFAFVVIYLDAQGNVLNADLTRSTGYADLDQATKDMVSTRWHFAPAAFNGKPASSAVALMVIWSLKPYDNSDSGKPKD